MSEHGGSHDRSTCCALHIVLVFPVVVLGIVWVFGFVEEALLVLTPLEPWGLEVWAAAVGPPLFEVQ